MMFCAIYDTYERSRNASLVMEREFERFKGGPTEASAKRIHVTIGPQKVILLNRNMYNILGKPSAVFLDYSRKRDIIAIEPTSPRFNEAFPVLPSGLNWRINAAPFCRHFGISTDVTVKFLNPEMVDSALHLKLDETISVGGRKRRKRGKVE